MRTENVGCTTFSQTAISKLASWLGMANNAFQDCPGVIYSCLETEPLDFKHARSQAFGGSGIQLDCPADLKFPGRYLICDDASLNQYEIGNIEFNWLPTVCSRFRHSASDSHYSNIFALTLDSVTLDWEYSRPLKNLYQKNMMLSGS